MATSTGRFSCKCLLCGAKWTTRKSQQETFDKHGEACERYAARFAARCSQIGSGGYRVTDSRADIERCERYQMAALYFQYRPIEGVVNDSCPCDRRCTSARGHNCECSCGGRNHGADHDDEGLGMMARYDMTRSAEVM